MTAAAAPIIPATGYDIIFGPALNELLSVWTARQIGDAHLEGGVGFGAVRDGKLIGAIVFTEHRGPDVRVSFAGFGPWLSRRLLRTAAAYAYRDLGCRRITAVVKRANKTSRRQVEKIGFRLEGSHPASFEDGGAACSYGMLREQCRWLEADNKEKKKNG